ncbi:MAG: hypothetical protein EAZ85_11535 [Bacteroidetes bacterium]|nr:MAG: hypothetical protein EAZ85_11535 [Bacteroidota bacterium]
MLIPLKIHKKMKSKKGINSKKTINRKVGTIHYKLCTDKRVIVNVMFYFYEENSKKLSLKTIPMIVDTGANVTLLNIKFAEKIGFKLNKRRTPQEEIETAGTKTEIAYKYIVPEIMLDDNGSPVVFVQNLEILVSEIRVIPEEFGGILGLDFFEDKKICLDLLNGTLDVT